MQNKIMKFGAKVTAAATMLAMFASVSPALAATSSATDMSDVMTRQAAAANDVGHHIKLTLGGALSDGDVVSFQVGNGGGNDLDFSGTLTGFASSGTCVVDTLTGNATGLLTVTVNNGGDCATSDTIEFLFTGGADNNGADAGSHSVTISSTGGTDHVSGTFAINISDDDQVTVTATVDPTITFDLDTATSNTDTNAPYTVDLGALTVGAANVSGATINSIWTDLETNATGGAVVTVVNANDTNGLVSLSSSDNIPATGGTIAAGTANYGLCVASATQGSGTYQAAGSYAAPTCVADTAGNTVVALSSSTPDPILNTAGGPVTAGRSQILVNAAISTSTTAHNDYQDVLTFVATGTF